MKLDATRCLLLLATFTGGCDEAPAATAGNDSAMTDGGSSTGGSGEHEGTTSTTTSGTTSNGDGKGDGTSGGDDGTPPGTTGMQATCDGQCVEAWPEDWNGPVVLRTAEGTDEPGECGELWPEAVGDVLHADIEAAAAECDCECEEDEDHPPICGDVGTLQMVGSLPFGGGDAPVVEPAPCVGPLLETWTLLPGTISLSGAESGRQWRLTVEADIEAVCTSTTVSQVDRSASVRKARLCAPAEEPRGDACSGGACVPEVHQPFGSEVCIWREGAHACPAAFSNTHVYYRGIDDDRGCSDCSCEAQGAACERGTARLQGRSLGFGDSGTRTVTEGSCATVSFAPLSVTFTPGSPNANTCQVANPSEPVGAAVPVDPVTVCCAPGA